MKLYVRLEAPFEWVRVVGSRVEAFGEVPSPADYPLAEEDELIAVVPGKWVTCHLLNLPARNKRQFQAAVPYALEESVSEDIDALHFSCSQWKAGEELVVHVVAKDKMRYWQQLANDNQLPLDRLLPDHALLPFHDAAECTIALAHSSSTTDLDLVTNHKNGSGVCIDPDFIDVWLMDIPLTTTIAVTDQSLAERLIEAHPDRDFRYWEAGNKLAHWLEYPSTDAIDLFTDEYRPSVRNFNWRSFAIPAALTAIAVFLVFAFDTYRYLALHAEIRSINTQKQAILRQHLPEITDLPDEGLHKLMERALLNRSGGPEKITATSMLAATAQVLRRQGVSLTEVVYREHELVITCALNDLSQVDKISTGLNAKPQISAQLESSAADDGRILASYILRAS